MISHSLKKHLRGVEHIHVGRSCYSSHSLTTPVWAGVGSVIGRSKFILIQHILPQRAWFHGVCFSPRKALSKSQVSGKSRCTLPLWCSPSSSGSGHIYLLNVCCLHILLSAFLNLCSVYYWLLWEEIYESNRGRWMKAFALWPLLISRPMFCVFAGCHNDVVQIVDLACKHNVCLMPYGGELWNRRR